MKLKKAYTMKELNLKEMENTGGGVIIMVNGKYWAASDPEGYYSCVYVNRPFDTLEEAQARAMKEGWSAKVYTQEEYKKAFNRSFNP